MDEAGTVEAQAEDERLAGEATRLAEHLLVRAGTLRTRAERARQRQVEAMVADPASRDFMIELTDEVLRIEQPVAATRRFTRLLAERGRPGFAGPLDGLLLRAAGSAGRLLPGVLIDQLHRRVRRELASVVLDSGEKSLAGEIAHRRGQGFQINVNPLGEAVLGDGEAEARLRQALDLLGRPEVEYVSVKASAVCANLDVLDLDGSVRRIAATFGRLGRAALGRDPAPFVNLDMEEYADLWPTVHGFTTALDEEELAGFGAGIVVQAYLPDSLAAFDTIAAWAVQRVAKGGAAVKVRLVKGANLAMENVDAELHGWAPAPFAGKPEVDANYKRLLDRALAPELAGAVRVGVASHNLFDVAWALTVAAERDALDRVDVEMLHGMAEAEAKAVVEHLGSQHRVVLYTPVVADADFGAATAYLVRRFDENTAPQNFLTHLSGLRAGAPAWADQEGRFRAAVQARHEAPATSRRQAEAEPDLAEGFANQPDADPTRPEVRERHLAAIAAFGFPAQVFSRVAGRDVRGGAGGQTALDPSTGKFAYDWVNLGVGDVEAAVAVGLQAAGDWAARPAAERRAILDRVAETMQQNRFATVATMCFDAGKTFHEADPEVSEAIDFARFYARCGLELGDGFEPHRLVVVAAPWNFPYAIPAGGVLAALAAGSSVILKPAPETILVARQLVEQCWAAGVPEAVLQLALTADDDAGRRLITHPEVGAVVLTGSSATARVFRRWRPDLRLHAETSGKNAVVVTAAADLDDAIRDVVRSAFGHAGQKCSAASLVLVEDAVLDRTRFTDRLADAVRSLRVGAGYDLRTQMGPLVREPEDDLLRALTRLEDGESWLVEPERVNGNPLSWTPGVKVGVRPGSHFHLTECFGPVLGVIRVADLGEALAVQNAIPYGLTAGLFSLDTGEIEHWLEFVEAGNLYVNRHITGAIVRRQPFGGWKQSSVGPGIKAGGPFYVGSLGRWKPLPDEEIADFAEKVQQLWLVWSTGSDPSALAGEANLLRLRPRPAVLLRAESDASPEHVVLAQTLARRIGVRLEVSQDEPVAAFLNRADTHAGAGTSTGTGFDRVRVLGTPSEALLTGAAEAGIDLDLRPVSSDPMQELLCWTREQAISQTLHRHGNIRT